MSASASTSTNHDHLPDGLPMPRRIYAAATLLLALVITVLDASMSNVALPIIAEELQLAPALVVWVAIAYSLTIVMTLLPLSALAERIGLGRMFALGTTVFMLASIGAVFSYDFTTLVSARILQGLGSSMLMCLFGGLVRNIYPLAQLGLGLSFNALTVSLTAVLGPSLGAFILEYGSWRWIFFINIPLCMLTWLGIRFFPRVPLSSKPFDWFAALLSFPVFGLSILGLDFLSTQYAIGLGLLALATLCGWVLIRHSLTRSEPMVPIDLLRITPVAYAVAASAFSFAAQMSSVVAIPFFFKSVMGYGYAEIGVMLGVWSLGVAIMAPTSAWLSSRFSIAILCATGAGIMAIGSFTLLLWDQQSPVYWVYLSMLLGGAGFGLFQTPNNRAMLAGIPRHRSAAAGGMQATTRVYGQSFGTALVALVFAASQSQGPVLGMVVAGSCALVSLFINIARHFNPASDPQLS